MLRTRQEVTSVIQAYLSEIEKSRHDNLGLSSPEYFPVHPVLEVLRPATTEELKSMHISLESEEGVCTLVPVLRPIGISEDLWPYPVFQIRSDELRFLQDLASKGDRRYLQYGHYTS